VRENSRFFCAQNSGFVKKTNKTHKKVNSRQATVKEKGHDYAKTVFNLHHDAIRCWMRHAP